MAQPDQPRANRRRYSREPSIVLGDVDNAVSYARDRYVSAIREVKEAEDRCEAARKKFEQAIEERYLFIIDVEGGLDVV